MTFFVRNSNYLMTIVCLVDRKGFRLEMLYGKRIFKNHEHRKHYSPPHSQYRLLYHSRKSIKVCRTPFSVASQIGVPYL